MGREGGEERRRERRRGGEEVRLLRLREVTGEGGKEEEVEEGD